MSPSLQADSLPSEPPGKHEQRPYKYQDQSGYMESKTTQEKRGQILGDEWGLPVNSSVYQFLN